MQYFQNPLSEKIHKDLVNLPTGRGHGILGYSLFCAFRSRYRDRLNLYSGGPQIFVCLLVSYEKKHEMHMNPRPVVFQKPGHLHSEVLHFSIRHAHLLHFL